MNRRNSWSEQVWQSSCWERLNLRLITVWIWSFILILLAQPKKENAKKEYFSFMIIYRIAKWKSSLPSKVWITMYVILKRDPVHRPMLSRRWWMQTCPKCPRAREWMLQPERARTLLPRTTMPRTRLLMWRSILCLILEYCLGSEEMEMSTSPSLIQTNCFSLCVWLTTKQQEAKTLNNTTQLATANSKKQTNKR